VARPLHVLGWHDEPADAPAALLAKQRYRLAVFVQMTQPGAPMVYYGDEVGLTGGEDPHNRGTYPWPDLGGRPDLALRAEVQRLIALRHAHPVLRRGTVSAPLHVDANVVVSLRRLGHSVALVASNNAGAARTVALSLPRDLRAARLEDAWGREVVQARNGRVTFTVPARFGRVLLSTPR